MQQQIIVAHEYSYFIQWYSIDVLHWFTLGLIFFWLKRGRLSFSDIGFNIRDNRNVQFLLAFLLTAFLLITYSELFLNRNNAHKIANRILWIGSCFTAGFCEELIWRGYILGSLVRGNIHKTVAVLCSSLCFALMHGMAAIHSLFYFCFLFFFAVVCCLVFLRTKKLALLMYIHMTYDLLYLFLYSLLSHT